MVILSMKKNILFAIFFLCICINVAYASPKRIMSLSPVATEILFALDEGDHIIGVTKFCDYPKEALSKPILCDFAEINYETILRANVDLVVLQDMHRQALEDLKALGIQYVVVQQNSVKNIMDSIMSLGRVCNKEKRAKGIVDKIQREISEIKKNLHGGETKSVLLCVSRDVNEEEIHNFYVAGSNVFYNELVEIAGGKNILSESPLQYPLMTIDGLMVLKPDIILDLVGDIGAQNTLNSKSIFDVEHIKNVWKKSLVSKLNTKIIPLVGTKFLRPGPRIVEILRAMNHALNSD